MLMASGANFGLRRTAPHMVGVVLGFAVLLSGVGLGLGALFALWPVLHFVLRWAGAAYLFWLAWKIATADSLGGKAAPRPLRFWEVVAFQWINPKAWVGAVGAISAYAPKTHYLSGLALIIAGAMAINIPVVLVWTGAGAGVRQFLDKPGRLRAFNIVLALLLALSVIPMLRP
jgi:threonine/homoserine/homoserine lactone efflux protein